MSPLEDMGTTHTHSGEGQVIDDVGNDVRGGQVIDDVETDVLLLPLHDVQRPWPPRGPDAWGPHVVSGCFLFFLPVCTLSFHLPYIFMCTCRIGPYIALSTCLPERVVGL